MCIHCHSTFNDDAKEEEGFRAGLERGFHREIFLILGYPTLPFIVSHVRPRIQLSACCAAGGLTAMSKFNDDSQRQPAEEMAGDTASTAPFTRPREFLDLPLPVTQASTADSGRQKKRKTARIDILRVYWVRFMKRVGTESPSTSSAIVDSGLDSSQSRPRTEDGSDADEVDEIVVDRDWTEDMKSSLDHSEHAPEKSGDSHIEGAQVGAGTGTSVGHESFTFPDNGGPFRQFLILLRWEVWPAVHKFFHIRFYDKKTEERYQKERWFIRKPLAIWSAIFFIANWVIGASTIAAPITILDKSWLWGVVPAHTIPLLFLVVFDFPRDRPIPYQLLLMISTWSWYVCGYYNTDNTCGTKDYLATFYYTSALQTIALFGMRMDRTAAMVGSLSFFIISSIFFLPNKPIWIRNLLNFLLYHTFLLFVHYMHENVRVPLNTARTVSDTLLSNRMDSGRFEILSKPYAFHAVMRSLFIPLRMATDARNLELVTYLDETIDKVARRAAYEVAGENLAKLEKDLDNKEDGIVLGDATRLRQIINNLARRKSELPESSDNPRPKIDTGEDAIEEVLCAPVDDPDPLPTPITSGGQGMELSTKKGPLKRIVVRIEVSDTGHGIPPREMAQGKLFSAFNQTEQGRQQGGKGTGLGLALVRQIVRLSGGRLGVRSKVGHGSTFWVELHPESTLREKQRTFELAGPLSVDLLTSCAPTQAVSTNIMQTMMDQGGLVQLNLPNAADDSESHLFSRTISELSSGAQLGLPLPTPPVDGSGQKNLSSPEMYSRVGNYSIDSSPTVVADSPKTLDDATPLPAALSMTTRPDPPVRKSSVASHFSGSLPLPVSRKGSGAGFDPPIIVLVVDDDRLTRTVMSRMLTRLGCHVSTAENGKIALEMIIGKTSRTRDERNPRVFDPSPDSERDRTDEDGTENGCVYDAVFLDNQMPVMSGLEVISKLREMGRGDFVVGVTGNALIHDQKEYSEAGVNQYVTL
ncbi:Tco5, signal transduction HAMP domain histidine kinase [Suillus paluster]|uniref:Tco5, signal transduction HAMP domain histidine kinase n=1 Tax=Suillus paluster TaxID=48578 RepID=UPI001B87CD9C|nr:Tco5, signal transduction HAMP domain histidine kinase [Suillus paluster]KAG1735881.1 Tco5, signal transduction HAMP domain histidine kinase [Suillus paluster]